MLNRDQQIGALRGFIIAILLIGGFLTLSSRLVPLYMNHNTMSKILDKMESESGLSGKNDSQLIELMNKRFRLNNIRDFPIGENVKFTRKNRGIDIVLDYEVRVPLISNLELIASFKKEVELND